MPYPESFSLEALIPFGILAALALAIANLIAALAARIFTLHVAWRSRRDARLALQRVARVEQNQLLLNDDLQQIASRIYWIETKGRTSKPTLKLLHFDGRN